MAGNAVHLSMEPNNGSLFGSFGILRKINKHLI